MGRDTEVKLIISADGKEPIAVSEEITKAYKTLAAQSIAEIDKKKSEITKAYETIKNSGVASAAEIRQAESAKNKAIAEAGKELLGNQKSMFSQIKEHWLGVTAAITTAYIAIGKGIEYAALGAKVLQVEEAFHNLSKTADEDMSNLVGTMRSAVNRTIDESDLMQKAIKGITQDLSSEDMIKIAETARVTARTQGIEVKEAFERISDSVANELPRALRAMGLLSKEQMSIINKAIAAGVEDVHLLDLAYNNARIKALELGAATETVAEKMAQSRANIQELREDLQKLTAKTWEVVVSIPADQWKALKNLYAALVKGESWRVMDPNALGVYEPPPPSDEDRKKYIEGEKKRVKDEEDKIKADTKAKEASKKAAQERAQYEKQIDEYVSKTMLTENEQIQHQVDIYKSVGVDKTKIAEYIAAREQEIAIKKYQFESKTESEALKHREDFTKEYEDLYFSVAETRMTVEEQALTKIDREENKRLGKLAELYLEGVVSFEESEDLKTWITENAERARAQLAAKIAENNVTLLTGIKGQEQNLYDFEMKLLQAKAEAYRQQGANESAIAAYVADQQQLSWIKMAAASDDAALGMEAAYLEIQRNLISAGQAGYEATKGSHTAMKDSFKNTLADVRKGTFELGDAVVNMCDRISSVFEDMLAEMLTNWLITGNAMKKAGLGSTGESGGILGTIIGWLANLGSSGNTSDYPTDWTGYVGSAKGNVFSTGLAPYRNSVVMKPTLFKFAHGIGLMGEGGGPGEAIMPLTRTSTGDLGVKAAGGAIKVTVNVINQTGVAVEAEQKDARWNGSEYVIDVVTRKAVASPGFRKTLQTGKP